MAIAYTTGVTTGSPGAVTQGTGLQVTLPSVTIGDWMFVIVGFFTWVSGAGITDLSCTAASGHTWTKQGVMETSNDQSSGLFSHSVIYKRQATSGDAGDVLTFKLVGTPASTDQEWWSCAMGSYSGALGGVDTMTVFNPSGTSNLDPVSCPSITTGKDNCWVLELGFVACFTSGAITGGSGCTLRQTTSNAGIAAALADSNGSVGATGTTVSGKGFTTTTGGANWLVNRSLSLDPNASAVTGTGAIAMKKMKIAIVGRLPGTGAIKMKKMRISATGNAPLRGTGAIKMKKMKLAAQGSQPDILAVFNNTSAGIDNYTITSPYNGPTPTSFRVLQPTSPAAGYPHAFVYSLSVAADGDNTFGQGLDTIKTGGWHNTYNITVVEPQFDIDPWYADSDTNQNRRYETFMVKLKDWVVAHLSSTGVEQHILIGFSKSGIGGQTLILHNPTVFDKCISWDFPADGDMYTRFGADAQANYGSDANTLANYMLDDATLNAKKTPFQAKNRLWIGSQALYGGDVSNYDGRLTSHGMLHTYPTPVTRTHDWNSGWVGPALADVMVLQTTGTGAIKMKKMRLGGTATAPLLGTGAIKMKKMRLSSSGRLTVSGTASVRMKKMRIRTTVPQGGTGSASNLLVFTEV